MTIAVTGASGWVGRAVAAKLENDGHSVRRLERTPSSPRSFRFDLADTAWRNNWPTLLEKADAIVHCAAYVHRARESADDARLFTLLNIEGPKRLLEAVKLAGVPRTILVSSSAIYGTGPHSVGSLEDSEPRPDSAYGRSKLATEELVRRSGGDWRIGRLATVCGPGDVANYLKLARALKKRRFFIPAEGEARKSFVPIGRAAEVVAQLATENGLAQFTVNVAAADSPSLAEICECFCRSCGFHRPIRLPMAACRAAAALGDLVEVIGGRCPWTSSTLSKLTTSNTVDITRLRSICHVERWESFAQCIERASAFYAAA